ncbi:hypothetical protein K435DRAFT_851419 [Dendrothele bispora CBS 962.96]|uniref:DUF6534 domain-containing protein n=1 Tax=Dendrothele bispora (strain CBS 962.96) TaxID=1314807 RepID=A0A4S8MNF6_DENBC|nr:hypothetical protein K435DRAFT_851419 [Dendrothele bispora CBS 962.96]
MKGPAEIAHGPMFIGFLFNVLLHGIMITQIYLYYGTFKNDNFWMKIFVGVLFFADSLNTIFDAIYLYDSLVKHFADIPYLGKATWVFGTDPALTGIIAGMVQLFFAWRVKVLTNNHWIVAVIVSAALAGLLGGVITAFEVGLIPEFVNFQEFKWSVILWLVAECFGDLVITTVLRTHKTGFQASDELIDRIIRLTMQTGLLTALVAFLDLFFFLTDPTGTHLIFNFPLSKLYANSLMSSLNSRGGWNYTNTPRMNFFTGGNSNNTNSSSNTVTPDMDRSTISRSSKKEDPRVFVHVESHEMRDHVVDVDKLQQVPGIIYGSELQDDVDGRSESDGDSLKLKREESINPAVLKRSRSDMV